MPLSVSQLIESADTSGDALRLIRAARDLTQADIVARSEGTIGADQNLAHRAWEAAHDVKPVHGHCEGAEPDRCARGAAHADGPYRPSTERLKPTLRQARLRIRLATVEAFFMAYPPDKMEAFIATMDAVAEVWPQVKANGKFPQNPAKAGLRPNEVSRGGTEHGV